MIYLGNMEEVSKMIETLGKQIRNIIYSAFELSYFSRGAWSYRDVLLMSAAEREIANDFISKRLELAGKMTTPVF